MSVTPEKLETFRKLVEADQRRGYLKTYPNSVNIDQACSCRLKMGKRYCNVDVGSSGKYMVTLEAGEIYGIKAYGVLHRGHYYGTLDTIDQWDWSGYVAHHKIMEAQRA